MLINYFSGNLIKIKFLFSGRKLLYISLTSNTFKNRYGKLIIGKQSRKKSVNFINNYFFSRVFFLK